ncbi:MAG: GAF domain-containing protein [Bacteroidota bacterium]
MKVPKIQSNEKDRLQNLNKFEILDSHSQLEYDQITYLATLVCSTPIALISFIDHDRQWIKSKIGITKSQYPRAISFCAHTINDEKGFMEVENAHGDLRFNDNPLVTESPQICFYAGVNLITSEGFPIGTLSVIDHKPRKLNEDELLGLEALSGQIMKLLELRLKNIEMNSKLAEFRGKIEELDLLTKALSHDLEQPFKALEGFKKLLEKKHTDRS